MSKIDKEIIELGQRMDELLDYLNTHGALEEYTALTKQLSSLKNELLEQFDQLARETRIPKSRLFDEAIEDLLKKYAAKDL